MKVAAMQTGSLGELMEALTSPAKTAQPVEGADFTAVLEEAGQALQAKPATETSPVMTEILSATTVDARLAEETVLPQVQAPSAFPQSERIIPTPDFRPMAVPAAGAELPVEELPTRAVTLEQALPQQAEPVRQSLHPETRMPGQRPQPQQLADGGEIVPQEAVVRDEDRSVIPVVREEKREATVKVAPAERQEQPVAAEVTAEPMPVIALAAAVPAPEVRLTPAEEGRDAVVEAAEPVMRRVSVEAAPAERVQVAPRQAVPEQRPEILRAEVAKPEVVRPEVVKADVVKPEPVKAEVLKPEAVKAEVVKPERLNAEISKPEAVRAEVVKPEMVKTEVVRAEPLRAEVVKPEVAKAEAVQPDTVQAATVEEVPTATRFEVAQGVAGYREHAFAVNLRKAPIADGPVQAPEAGKVVAGTASVPVEKPAQEANIPAFSSETPEVVTAKAEEPTSIQEVAPRQQKAEVGTPIAVKPEVASSEAVKVARPETAIQSEPKAVAAHAVEAARDPHRTAAARQQAPRQEQVEEQVQPVAKEAGETGTAKPVVEVAIREKTGAEAGGEGQQKFSENSQHRHLEALQQPLDTNRQQFQVAEPVKQEMPQPERNDLHESILSQIRDRVETTNVDGNREVTVRLNPEELGELTISIRMDGRSVKVDVVAENATVKEALMENVDRLKETFSRQNMTMEQFDVSTGSGGRFQQQAQREQHRAMQAPAWFGHMNAPAQVPADEQKVAAYYKPRENSLIDVRF